MVKKKIKTPIFFLASIILIGTFGYHIIEGRNYLDSFYWTIVTITTVGYGDLPIKTSLGKLFAVVLISSGVGVILYTFTVIGQKIFEGSVWKIFTMKEKAEEVKQKQNHLVVCGYGDVGEAITQQLISHKKEVVLIDKDEEVLRSEAPELPYIVGDATKEETLKMANLSKAKGLFAAIPDDSDNILLVLTAKEINPDIRVVARLERPEGDKHIRRVGAEAVIHPDNEGGTRMAQSYLHPEVTNLYDDLLKGESGKAGTIKVTKKSGLVGKTLKESDLKEKHGLLVVAIKKDSEIILNPDYNQKLEAGDTLIVMGTGSQIDEIKI